MFLHFKFSRFSAPPCLCYLPADSHHQRKPEADVPFNFTPAAYDFRNNCESDNPLAIQGGGVTKNVLEYRVGLNTQSRKLFRLEVKSGRWAYA
jgi:hypothetical protein